MAPFVFSPHLILDSEMGLHFGKHNWDKEREREREKKKPSVDDSEERIERAYDDEEGGKRTGYSYRKCGRWFLV